MTNPKDISEATEPKTFNENKSVAQQGGEVARVARKELEAKTGKKVVSALNAKDVLQKQILTGSDDEIDSP